MRRFIGSTLFVRGTVYHACARTVYRSERVWYTLAGVWIVGFWLAHLLALEISWIVASVWLTYLDIFDYWLLDATPHALYQVDLCLFSCLVSLRLCEKTLFHWLYFGIRPLLSILTLYIYILTLVYKANVPLTGDNCNANTNSETNFSLIRDISKAKPNLAS